MRRAGSTLSGLVLIAIGGYFLLDRVAGVHLPRLGAYWPLLLVLLGVSRLVAGRPASGIALVLMGTAFLTGSMGWIGFSLSTVWPLLIVAAGVGMVIRAFVNCDSKSANGTVQHD